MSLLLNFTELTNLNDSVDLDIEPMQDLRYFLFFKDMKGKYLNCNQQMALESGFNSKKDIIGLTDFDFPCFSEKEAHIFRKNDQEVIVKESLISCIEPITLSQNRKYCALTQKYPLRSNNKIIGNIGFSLLVEKNEIMLPSETAQTELDSEFLTARQLDCLFYLVKGMSYKQIAAKLAISPRTVGHHIDAMKEKLNCYNRAALVAKALKFPLIIEKLLKNK
ncbi:MAG: helix-turn-helix transcriptional regulator [Tatlockia sp.]|jgi:DNA-binding CsgD family transcriptional regulator